jgi:hypothetical protein
MTTTSSGVRLRGRNTAASGQSGNAPAPAVIDQLGNSNDQERLESN